MPLSPTRRRSSCARGPRALSPPRKRCRSGGVGCGTIWLNGAGSASRSCWGLGHRWRGTWSLQDLGSRPQRPVNRLSQQVVSVHHGSLRRPETATFTDNASDFTGRKLSSPQVPSHPHRAPPIGRDQHERHADSPYHHPPSPPVAPRPARPGVTRRESGGKSDRPTGVGHPASRATWGLQAGE
jgi:hypothetical protein